jgi:hypothetical protein
MRSKTVAVAIAAVLAPTLLVGAADAARRRQPSESGVAGKVTAAVSALVDIGIGHVGGEVEQTCETPQEQQTDLAREIVSGVTGAVIGRAASDLAQPIVGEHIGEIAGGATGSAVTRFLDLTLQKAATDQSPGARLSRQLCEIVKARRLIAKSLFDDLADRMSRTCNLSAEELTTKEAVLRAGAACMSRTEAGYAAFAQTANNIYTMNVAACAAAEATMRRIENESQRDRRPGESAMPRIDMGCSSPDDFEREWSFYFRDRIAPRAN